MVWLLSLPQSSPYIHRGMLRVATYIVLFCLCIVSNSPMHLYRSIMALKNVFLAINDTSGVVGDNLFDLRFLACNLIDAFCAHNPT